MSLCVCPFEAHSPISRLHLQMGTATAASIRLRQEKPWARVQQANLLQARKEKSQG